MHPIFLAMLLTAAGPTFDVQTVDGPPLSGTIAAMSAEKLTFRTSSGSTSSGLTTVDAEQILSITAKEKPVAARSAGDIALVLMDGSLAQARQFAVEGKDARVTLVDGQSLTVPLAAVKAVRLQRESEGTTPEWTRLLALKADADLLVVRKDDAINYHQGVVREITDDSVKFDLDGEVLPVKRAKVFGLIYRHAGDTALLPAVCRLTDAAGSLWAVRSMSLGDKLQLETPAGVKVSLPLEQIARIEFANDKLVCLGNLKPDAVSWKPYFGGKRLPPAVAEFYAPRVDRDFDGQGLELGGKSYAKGLALQTHTEATYRLPDAFRRFRATTGLAAAARSSKVRLIIRGDERELFNAVLDGRDEPRSLDLDLTGVRRLTIVVDFAEKRAAGGSLLLCNARLSK